MTNINPTDVINLQNVPSDKVAKINSVLNQIASTQEGQAILQRMFREVKE